MTRQQVTAPLCSFSCQNPKRFGPCGFQQCGFLHLYVLRGLWMTFSAAFRLFHCRIPTRAFTFLLAPLIPGQIYEGSIAPEACTEMPW